MEKRIRILKELGCDTECALKRFINDEELYLTCTKELLYDDTFLKLDNAIKNHDKNNAFNYAHTLKGVLINMGFIPMYEICCKMVDTLRNNSEENLPQLFEKLISEKNLFIKKLNI